MFAAALLAISAMVTPPPEAAVAVDAALADAARRFGVQAELAAVEAVTWPDGSLGCPQKGVNYPQALVDGWRITLRGGERDFDYHASRANFVVYCAPGRSRKPLPPSAADR